MKKFMYCACVAALATACTNEDLIQENEAIKSSKGITFEASIANETPATRGEMIVGGISESGNKLWNFFWYAEQDRINVYALNEDVNFVYPDLAATAGVSMPTQWSQACGLAGYEEAVTAPIYKATKSAASGQFTAKDDANLIAFKGTNDNVDFIATYPTTTKVWNVKSTYLGWPENRHKITEFGLVIEKPNAVQNVTYNQVDAPMYSKTTASSQKGYESVGEKVQLDFVRPFPVLRFGSVAGNNDYNKYLGKLQSISVETKGAENGEYTLPATAIGREMADARQTDGSWVSDVLGIGQTNKVTVNITPAANWNSDNVVFMSIMPVQRKGIVQADETKVDFEEDYVVTYDYANVTLAKPLKSSADWNVEHRIYGIKDLDIAKDFKYIVTKDLETLIIFSGNYSDIYTSDKKAIKWESATDGKVAFGSIKNIVVEKGVTVTTTDFQNLNQFTALESLEMKGVESIPAYTFDGALTSTITKLILPEVTSIDKNNNVFSALVNLDLSKYGFTVPGIETKFFNENVKNTLVTLDIEAVKSLRPIFSVDRTIAFTDYTKLESVVLNNTEGVALTTAAFKNCTSLKTVTGIVNIANAPNAFEGTTALSTVNVANTIIPNYAFWKSTVKNVKLNGEQVAPTEVGEYAFKNNTGIYKMDLSQTTKIGKDAFSGASNFKGMVDNDISKDATVLTVGAETINQGIFYGTAIKYVQFENATTLGDKVFGNCSSLKHVKFLKVVTGDYTTVSPFGTTTTENIDLFVLPAQSDINGNTWELIGKGFKSITKEITKWGE